MARRKKDAAPTEPKPPADPFGDRAFVAAKSKAELSPAARKRGATKKPKTLAEETAEERAKRLAEAAKPVEPVKAEPPAPRFKADRKSRSLYKPEYDDIAETVLASGKSLAALAGTLGVSPRTVDQWIATHESFKDACEVGRAQGTLDWERRLEDITKGAADPKTTTAVIFGLCNRGFGQWRQRVENTHAGAEGKPPIGVSHTYTPDLSKMSRDDLAALERISRAVARPTERAH